MIRAGRARPIRRRIEGRGRAARVLRFRSAHVSMRSRLRATSFYFDRARARDAVAAAVESQGVESSVSIAAAAASDPPDHEPRIRLT